MATLRSPQVQKLETLRSIISAPFIRVEFGGAEFGFRFNSYNRGTYTRDIRYVTKLDVNKKASGQVNTYTLNMTYVVEPGMDPNYIDYIISNSLDRKITFSYGDANEPESSFIEEQAIITNVTPSVNISTHSIEYTITATSSSAINYSVRKNYASRGIKKPSEILLETLFNKDNGLTTLFTGMKTRENVQQKGWIAQDDEAVNIEAKSDISPLDYMRYLVSLMHSPTNAFYTMILHDEPDQLDGPYFEVISSDLHQGTGNRYSVDIDIGYPSDTPIFSFTPQQNTSLALVTEYQEKLDTMKPININVFGTEQVSGTPSLAIRNGKVSGQLKQWWETMTAYPITATLSTRGLIRPSILCDYVKINLLFFGQPYNYSGYYMVTGQQDSISSSGYITQLSLVRVEGEKLDV